MTGEGEELLDDVGALDVLLESGVPLCSPGEGVGLGPKGSMFRKERNLGMFEPLFMSGFPLGADGCCKREVDEADAGEPGLDDGLPNEISTLR